MTSFKKFIIKYALLKVLRVGVTCMCWLLHFSNIPIKFGLQMNEVGSVCHGSALL